MAGADATTGRVGELLSFESIDDPTDRRTVEAAWAFLQQPWTGDYAALSDHAGNVDMILVMGGADAPVIEDVSRRLNAFQVQCAIADARAELATDAPDLLRLKLLVKTASSVTPRPMGATEQIAALTGDIDARGLHNEAYDRMVATAAIIDEVAPHLAAAKDITTMTTAAAGLREGDVRCVKVARDVAAKLRANAYPVKDAESNAVLHLIAARIEQSAT